MSDCDPRAALRARLGPGARYDASAAPAEALLLARRGTAYFSRKLGQLSDEALARPSRRPGLSRRHLIAQVGYQARDMAAAIALLRGGVAGSDRGDAWIGPDGIAAAASLPARALRSLFHHASIHLDVEWRDLSDDDWARPLTLPDERMVAMRHWPVIRAQALWWGGVDLGNGGRAGDVPPGITRPEAAPVLP